MIRVYSSSSDMQERSASNSYHYSTEDLDDDDYVMEGDSQEDDRYSYSTETPEEEEDDDDQILVKKAVDEKQLNDLTESFAKTPEFPREKSPEKAAPGEKTNPVFTPYDIKLDLRISHRWVLSGIGWVLLNLLKMALIMGLCLQMASMINKNYDKQLVIPKFTLESVSVFLIQVDPVSNSTTGHNVTAGWTMIFGVTNPSENHLLLYQNVAAEVYFGKSPLHHAWPFLPGLNKIAPLSLTVKSIWKTAVPGFIQEIENQDFVKVTFASSPVSIDNATAASLVKDISSGTSRGFSVRLNGNITQRDLEKEEPIWETGSFSAQCRLNMAFFQSGGVVAASSKECKVVASGLDSWMLLAISVAAVHATLRACFFLSSKFLGKSRKI